ncbi:SGNH/GDSL hydrolase family protein [Desulfosarcina sp.]|uniref:SGNH/GDSL hydrolase family protein n=1 Tax=Desulfosarcina sp. TaxID=2027861 RepID=UPI0039708ECF
MVFGDSNAYRPGNGRNCWPAMLQRNSANTLWVINESCDGRTTQFDAGVYNGQMVIEQKIRSAQPLTIVVIALGTNDLKVQYGPPDGVAVVEGVEKLLNILTSVDDCISPVLLTPPPLGDVINAGLAGAQGRLPTVVSGYRRLAASRKITLIDIYAAIDAGRDLENDGVHLNARGRKTVADAVWNRLRRGHHFQGVRREGTGKKTSATKQEPPCAR